MRRGRCWRGGRALLTIVMALMLIARPAGPAAADAPAPELNVIGQLGGAAIATAAWGNRAVVTIGPRVALVDVGDGTPPTPIAMSDPLPGLVRRLAVDGHFAYAATSTGLRILDLTSPSGPREVGALAMQGVPMSIAVAGKYAYVGVSISDQYGNETSGALRIVDISTPGRPTEVGSVGTNGGVHAVAVASGYAYISRVVSTRFLSGALQAINVRDPAHPVAVNEVQAVPAEQVVVSGNQLYVAHYFGGLLIYSIADPAALRLTGRYDVPGGVKDVAVAGERAYLTETGGAALHVVDVTNPAQPVPIGGAALSGEPQQLIVVGATALVAAGSAGVLTYDVSHDVGARRSGTLQPAVGPVMQLADANGQVSILTPTLNVLDLTDVQRATLLGAAPITGWRLAVHDQYAYVVARKDGLRVIDLHDPAHPTQVARLPLPGVGSDIAIAGNMAYVAAGYGGGMRIIDITDPRHPVERGAQTAWAVEDVAVAGNLAFLAAGTGGLHILDVSKPASPVEVGAYNTPVADPTQAPFQGGVAVDGTRVYLIGWAGLRVLDVSTPSRPVEIGHYQLPNPATIRSYAIAAAGGMVYTTLDGNVQAFDVAKSGSPVLAGSLMVPGGTSAIAVSGDRVYVAAGTGGLWVLPRVSIDARQEAIRALYRDVLARDADPDGLQGWTTSNLSLEDVRAALTDSPEGQRVGQIRALYRDLFGRDPLHTDDAGLRYWVNSGLSLPDIEGALRQTPEYKARHP